MGILTQHYTFILFFLLLFKNEYLGYCRHYRDLKFSTNISYFIYFIFIYDIYYVVYKYEYIFKMFVFIMLLTDI